MKGILTLLSLTLILAACGVKVEKPRYMQGVVDVDELSNIDNKFERFRQQIMGHFSNREQLAANPKLKEAEQEFIITPIFKHRPDEFWVYIEFFSPGLLEQPLDQRIEQYVRVARDTFRMEVYYLKDPKKYINEWKKAVPFENLSKREDLIRNESCDLFIVPNEEKRHTFRTLPPDEVICGMRGSKGATKFVDLFFNLSDAGYNMRFKFYDESKELLRETEQRGIDFKRLDYKDSSYPRYDIK